MNQGRIWCVVNPTIGLPLFLGSVALTSLAVHTAVMTHTTWMSTYWQGKAKAVAMKGTASSVASLATPGFVVSVNPVASTNGTSFVVNVAPSAVQTASAHPVALAAK
jgi:light-harvesting protein B-800-850 alpha chain